jgi:hypothetical protein
MLMPNRIRVAVLLIKHVQPINERQAGEIQFFVRRLKAILGVAFISAAALGL